MKFLKTDFEGLIVIEPEVYEDERGYFFESYNHADFIKNGINVAFLQDNQSLSKKNTLRGLHFQSPPYAQAKLVRVVKGSVLDVVVDIRKNSPTFGKHFKLELNEDNKKMLYIPEGFAHGFVTLEDDTLFLYKCSNIYHKPSEGGILWNDSFLAIEWGITAPLISEKDKNLQPFKTFKTPF